MKTQPLTLNRQNLVILKKKECVPQTKSFYGIIIQLIAER